MPRTKLKSDDEILDLALPIIRGKDPDGFTFKEVSLATGISPSTLVQRFGSKEGLLKYVVERELKNINQQIENLKLRSLNKNLGQSPKESIFNLFEEMGQFIQRPKDVHDGLNALKLDIIDPHFNQLSRHFFEATKKQLVELLKLAKKKQQLKYALKVEDLAEILLDVFQGYAILWAINPKTSFQKGLKQKINLFL